MGGHRRGPVLAGGPARADHRPAGRARRERLDAEIRRKAVCWSIAAASVAEIDTINILRAALLAMQRAVQGLRLLPNRVVVDGNRVPGLPMTVVAVVKGDARVAAISAASILAKVHRDRLCLELHREYPQYGFDGHKGYPTAGHLAALNEHGACAAHRRSFAPVRSRLGQR